MVETPRTPENRLSDNAGASQPPTTWSTSISARNMRARSEDSSTTGALTPTSSRSGSTGAPNGQSKSPHYDVPLPSIERRIEALEIDSVNVSVSPAPVHNSSTPSINGPFDDLQVGGRTSVTADHRGSLSPGPQHGTSSRPRSRHRSSSRNNVQRHEVDQEEPPASNFYSRDFQDAITQSKGIARQLADALSSCDLHMDESSAIQGLHSQARDASNYCGPMNWTIGLVGDSGAGEYILVRLVSTVRN